MICHIRGVGAHPRSRGENKSFHVDSVNGVGSSPLTRGKPVPRQSALIEVGLIPAHAGKTQPIQAESHGKGAHPRSRGENIKAAVSVVVEWGSSPLTRGKPGRCAAGEYARWAHPRSRGENIRQESNGYGNLGSSPLTRGKPGRALHRRVQGGLIPAHAGKTFLYRADF